MLFWVIAIALAVLGVLPVLAALWRSGEGASAQSDIAVYRDQLAEIDRDLARGTLRPDEAERTRAEVARRLLEADKRGAASVSTAPRPARIAGVAAVTLAVMAGGIALYAGVGAPGYPDMGLATRLLAAEEARESRPTQAEAEREAAPSLPDPVEPEGDFAELMDRLRAAMTERPDDARGWELLAQNEARLGNYAAARRAQERLVELRGAAASPAELSALGELMVMAAGGRVTAEAEQRFDAALALAPSQRQALYYKGLSQLQTGRPDRTFRVWRALLETGPAGDPWADAIRPRIADVAARAGIEYTPPAPRPGPSAEDMANAADMSAEERQAMVEGMVSRLSDRLATEGGPAPDWARLIAALGVLGRTDRARAIADEARQVFANQPDDLAAIEDAAAQAGVAE